MSEHAAFQTIQKWVDLCKYRRDTYWRMHYMFSRRSNYMTIPLILLASSTTLTSASQLSASSTALIWVTATSGALSAALAAMQRYFRYAERAEQCKSLAKGYGLLGTKLETKQAILSSLPTADPTHTIPLEDLKELMNYAEEIRKSMEELMKETDDAPHGFDDPTNHFAFVYSRPPGTLQQLSDAGMRRISFNMVAGGGQLSPPSSVYTPRETTEPKPEP